MSAPDSTAPPLPLSTVRLQFIFDILLYIILHFQYLLTTPFLFSLFFSFQKENITPISTKIAVLYGTLFYHAFINSSSKHYYVFKCNTYCSQELNESRSELLGRIQSLKQVTFYHFSH